MLKFVNTVALVDDNQDRYPSQLDRDMATLSAAVVYMADYYDKVFSDLDAMVAACNQAVGKDQEANK